MLVRNARRAGRPATTMVETAVVALVTFLFMFAIFEFGRVIQMRNMMENAARSGARLAVVTATSYLDPAVATQDINNAVNAALAGANLQNVTITIFQADSNGNNIGAWTAAPFGQNIVVQVDADYPNIFPTLGMLPTSGAWPNSTHITAVSMMRGEAN